MARTNRVPLSVHITKSASARTFRIIQLLVNRGQKRNACCAYAYFRWVDDSLDKPELDNVDRDRFIERQQQLLAYAFDRHSTLPHIMPEEQLLLELVGSDNAKEPSIQSYVYNLMNVMVFDAKRAGRLISNQELAQYSLDLSRAVTDALHYFIGQPADAPENPLRYRAVGGAHIAHMLRDTYEDLASGYFNIPREYLHEHNITPHDVDTNAYRMWVRQRVQAARDCFADGKHYLRSVRNARCRLAGYVYMTQFESVLRTIENDNYQLRKNYDTSRDFSKNLLASLNVLGMFAYQPQGLLK